MRPAWFWLAGVAGAVLVPANRSDKLVGWPAMSYLVLARKYRPRQFADVVGQTPVVRALGNALDSGRLHHAYLFTGTRGVGKTTLARILAACFNCESGVTATPCGSCEACAAIAAGRFMDLIEVDAASRTGVEDTRELLSNAQFLPGQGRYKVYLIDEVHMLSGHSFNALLKTLEEPPEHVKFLLATTEAKKIPVTVLSRCLQFNLKNMLPDAIAAQLAKVLAAEDIDAESEALALIARAAAGSMRDALSIADQAIAHGGGAVTTANVGDMLGIAGRDEVGALLDALAAKDSARLLAAGDDLAGRAVDLGAVLAELQRAFHALAIATELGTAPPPPYERFQGAFGAEDLQLYFQIALMSGHDLEFAADAKVGFDMALLRLCSFEPAAASEREPRQPREPPQSASGPKRAKPQPSPPRAPAPSAAGAPAVKANSPPPAAAAAPEAGDAPGQAGDTTVQGGDAPVRAVENWHKLVAQMAPAGVTAMILNRSNLIERDGAAWTLLLDPSHESLLNQKQRAEVARLAGGVEGQPVDVRFRFGKTVAETPAARTERTAREALAKAQATLAEDAVARALMRDFDARLESAQLNAGVPQAS